MSDVKISGILNSDVNQQPGGSPVAAEYGVSADQTSVMGNGTIHDPLRAVPGGVGVAVDDVSIAGDGTTDDPLHTLSFGTQVLVDGTTIVGSGVTGDPLIAIGGGGGGGFIQPFTYTVTGVEPDLANLVIPVSPSQPDGAYVVVSSQGNRASFLGMAIESQVGAHFVLALTNVATAGDVFEFVLTRP